MSVGTQDARRRLKRALQRAFIGTMILALLGLGISWHVASQLVAPYPRAAGIPPSSFPAETVEITGAPGTVLSGWYLPHSTPKGAVLLLHGIRSSRLSMVKRAQMLPTLDTPAFSTAIQRNTASGCSRFLTGILAGATDRLSGRNHTRCGQPTSAMT